MYLANFEVEEQDCPSKLLIRDISTGNETPSVRTITLYKTDLVPSIYTFEVGENELLIENLTQDFVFSANYQATPGSGIGSIYAMTHDFIILGYSNKAKYDRAVALEVDECIVNKQRYKAETNEIEYYYNAALTFIINSNLVDAQKCLNYIKELSGYSSLDC